MIGQRRAGVETWVRVAGLVQLVVMVACWWPRSAGGWAVTTALVLTSALSRVLYWRARDPIRRYIGVADLLVIAALLAVGAATQAVVTFWPVLVSTAAGLGLAQRGPRLITAGVAVLCLPYLLVSVLVAGHPLQRVLPGLLATVLVAGLVHRGMRGWQARDRALRQAVEQAVLSERQRHARMLHDRVLATLAILTQTDAISDPTLRNAVAAEAQWLRTFVVDAQRGADQTRTDLLTGLGDLAEQAARGGLDVELSTNDLRRRLEEGLAVPANRADALIEATREALANVSRHAHTRNAVVHAAVEHDQVVISIVDHGGGFDPDTATEGFGLRHSIRDRLTEIGGAATVDSVPGEGTSVRLAVPITAHDPR
jgi:signal transduction histidine kinase